MDPLEMLAGSELFNGASAADFEPLARSAHTRMYDRGEFIFHAADEADAMYLVLEGEVVVSRLGPDGEEYVVEVFVAGDVLGQLHFFERSPTRLLHARAGVAASCWIASKHEVLRLLDRNPKLMLLILRTYSRWIMQRDLRGAEGAFRNLTSRVVTRLLQLADQYGEAMEGGTRIKLRLSETTLANMLGASRENVSRALAQLLRSGDVRREGGFLLIPRPDDLRNRYSWVTANEARALSSKEVLGVRALSLQRARRTPGTGR
jgi:CRP/FNR family transcriptional regulator, cyclic AMP receptor protein